MSRVTTRCAPPSAAATEKPSVYPNRSSTRRPPEIERVAVDPATPSAFARGILNGAPYTFLDGAPLEERRTQAVITRSILDVQVADDLGALDPAAVARVKAEAWPAPADAEDRHEPLLWMGYVTEAEAAQWRAHVEALEAAGRVVWALGRCYAAEVARSPARMEPRALLRGRVEASAGLHRPCGS